jgi:hypothetical protein
MQHYLSDGSSKDKEAKKLNFPSTGAGVLNSSFEEIPTFTPRGGFDGVGVGKSTA